MLWFSNQVLATTRGFLEGDCWIKDISTHTGAFAFSCHFYSTTAPRALVDGQDDIKIKFPGKLFEAIHTFQDSNNC